MELIALDPTYTGKDSAGKYGKWLLNLYNRGKISENDFDEITPLLNQFKIYKNRIQNKDLNSYKTLDDLAQVLASVVDDDSMLTPRQKVRFLKNVKSGKVQSDASDDYDIVLDTPNFIVYVPNTHEASMKLGKGTKWCTAHENPGWYKDYTEDGHKLYIIKDKKTGERWQYSDKTNDFLDQNDDSFRVSYLMIKDEALSQFFEKFFNRPFVSEGYEVPRYLKDKISNIIIKDGTHTIKTNAFAECYNVTDITIPDSVTGIGNNAFYFCTSLISINLPNSITEIGYQAFFNCENLASVHISDNITEIAFSTFFNCNNLTNITIPNGVINIGRNAFYGCQKLTRLIIPDSVTYIGNGAFDDCPNLIIYTDNDYAINYCNENNIPVKPLSERPKNESYRKQNKLKLKIRE